MSHRQKTQEQYERFGKLVAEGMPRKQAMIEAGWSPAQAAKGQAAVSKPMLDAVVEALAKQGKELEALGSSMTPEQQENIARGRLAMNTIAGSDDGVQSAKLLWQDKRVGALTADTAVQCVIVQAPERPQGAVPIHYEPPTRMLEE
jgi:hypothetical protein